MCVWNKGFQSPGMCMPVFTLSRRLWVLVPEWAKRCAYFIVQSPDFAHGWQAGLLPADVPKHLKDHEAQKQEVEAEADPSHNDEGHLMVSSQGNGRLAKKLKYCSPGLWPIRFVSKYVRNFQGDKMLKPGILISTIEVFWHRSSSEECSKLLLSQVRRTRSCLLEMQTLGSEVDLLNQNLPFNKVPRRVMCTGKLKSTKSLDIGSKILIRWKAALKSPPELKKTGAQVSPQIHRNRFSKG